MECSRGTGQKWTGWTGWTGWVPAADGLSHVKGHAGGLEAGRGGGKREHRRLSTGLDDYYAVTVEGVSLIGPVGVVIGRIAVGHAQNPATAGELEGDAIDCVRD